MELALVSTILVLTILSTMDVLTTQRILAKGGRELNPVVAFFMRFMGGYWFAIKIVLVAAVTAAAWWFPSWALVWAIWFGNLATAWAVYNNLTVIRKHQW